MIISPPGLERVLRTILWLVSRLLPSANALCGRLIAKRRGRRGDIRLWVRLAFFFFFPLFCRIYPRFWAIEKQENRQYYECNHEKKWCDVWKWPKLEVGNVKSGNFLHLAIIVGRDLFEKLSEHADRLNISL